MDSNLASWLLNPQVNFINKGAVNEAFVGQEILTYSPPYRKAQLYYWQREKRSSSAEIDYVIQKSAKILPIEVKSGSPGTLKSMHLFLKENTEIDYGIRFSSLDFNQDKRIKSFPLYSVFLLFEEMKEKILKIL